MITVRLSTLAAVCGLLTSVCLAQTGGQVAVCPWKFTDGNVTSRTMVVDTISKILEHHGYAVLPQTDVQGGFDSLSPAFRSHKGGPDVNELARYASAVHADRLVFGRASWNTRSIWVGTGPKTISTATINLYVYNAKKGTITYQKRGATGRSDERESEIKDLGDILLTPFITVISGGPATPREQRAAQIAIARAMRPWIHRDVAMK